MNGIPGEAGEAELLLSVDDACPDEAGGPIARSGFNYQDEVGVLFLLQMLEDPLLLRIHCETHDDLVLVWDVGENRTAEYVQVKGSEPGKLWSVADLCKKDSPGGSIYSKSLSKDCHKEQSQFRIVTLQGTNEELKPLSFPRSSIGRQMKAAELTSLSDDIDTRSSKHKSKKKNGAAFWLEACVWDVRHDQDDIAADNLKNVIRIAHAEKRLISYEQAEDILNDLRKIAKDAGAAKYVPDKDKKVISRAFLREWWDKRLISILDGSQPAGGKLRAKLKDAGATDDLIQSAVEQRLRYATLSRTSKYMNDDAAGDLQSSVRAAMLAARLEYLTQEPAVAPLEFLSICLKEAKTIAESHPCDISGRREFANGCVFDIADRCLLRFTRTST